jgi:acetyl-CoA C-acetyltransferase
LAAAAAIVCQASTAHDERLESMLTIRGIGVAGAEPGMFGLGPLPAIRRALDRADWMVGDVGLGCAASSRRTGIGI